MRDLLGDGLLDRNADLLSYNQRQTARLIPNTVIYQVLHSLSVPLPREGLQFL